MKSVAPFLLAVFVFISCKKEAQNDTQCGSNTQIQEILNLVKQQTTTEIYPSQSERQLMDSIRTIANSIDEMYMHIDTTISLHQRYIQIKSNFLQHVAQVERMAQQFYPNSAANVILAKNAFVLMSYDALTRKYPEFLWTKLGVFAANEVRWGLTDALYVRYVLLRNHINIPFDNTHSFDEALMESSQVLIQGQIDVLTDIGTLGIMNRLVGAGRMKTENWLTNEAKSGFNIQEHAELLKQQNNLSGYYDEQTEAAIQFGAHEQINILQPMWDKPMMQKIAQIDQLFIQLTGHQFVFFGDIFVGVNKDTQKGQGYTIHIPKNVNNLANAQQRVQIAINGFHTLNTLRKQDNWCYWINLSQISIGYYYGVYNTSGISL